MTEKRSAYRHQQERKQGKKLLGKFKAAFDDEDSSLDVNPAFERSHKQKRNSDQERKFAETGYQENSEFNLPAGDKGLRLKKKLDRAILIVFVLIVLVLLALFYL